MEGIGDVNDYVPINFQNAQGNLDLMLYDANGFKINSSVTTAGEERISLNDVGPGANKTPTHRSAVPWSVWALDQLAVTQGNIALNLISV